MVMTYCRLLLRQGQLLMLHLQFAQGGVGGVVCAANARAAHRAVPLSRQMKRCHVLQALAAPYRTKPISRAEQRQIIIILFIFILLSLILECYRQY